MEAVSGLTWAFIAPVAKLLAIVAWSVLCAWAGWMWNEKGWGSAAALPLVFLVMALTGEARADQQVDQYMATLAQQSTDVLLSGIKQVGGYLLAVVALLALLGLVIGLIKMAYKGLSRT